MKAPGNGAPVRSKSSSSQSIFKVFRDETMVIKRHFERFLNGFQREAQAYPCKIGLLQGEKTSALVNFYYFFLRNAAIFRTGRVWVIDKIRDSASLERITWQNGRQVGTK